MTDNIAVISTPAGTNTAGDQKNNRVVVCRTATLTYYNLVKALRKFEVYSDEFKSEKTVIFTTEQFGDSYNIAVKFDKKDVIIKIYSYPLKLLFKTNTQSFTLESYKEDDKFEYSKLTIFRTHGFTNYVVIDNIRSNPHRDLLRNNNISEAEL